MPVCLIPSWRKVELFYTPTPIDLGRVGKSLPDTSSPLPSGLSLVKIFAPVWHGLVEMGMLR